MNVLMLPNAWHFHPRYMFHSEKKMSFVSTLDLKEIIKTLLALICFIRKHDCQLKIFENFCQAGNFFQLVD